MAWARAGGGAWGRTSREGLGSSSVEGGATAEGAIGGPAGAIAAPTRSGGFGGTGAMSRAGGCGNGGTVRCPALPCSPAEGGFWGVGFIAPLAPSGRRGASTGGIAAATAAGTAGGAVDGGGSFDLFGAGAETIASRRASRVAPATLATEGSGLTAGVGAGGAAATTGAGGLVGAVEGRVSSAGFAAGAGGTASRRASLVALGTLGAEG